MPAEIKERAAAPKYLQLAHRLRRQVESGALKPGDRLPSFAEMRLQFGANAATVERVYRVLEQEKLIVRQHRRGIFVASPQRVSTGVIGVNGVTSARWQQVPYFAHLIGGIQETAEGAGLEVLLLGEASTRKWERVDGVLNCDLSLKTALAGLPPEMPCVTLLSPFPNRTAVMADDRQGARDATQHLLEMGHRRIGFLATKAEPILQRRLAGYREALGEAGIVPEERWMRQLVGRQTNYWELGRRNMQEWLRDDWHELACSALLTQNDQTAIGVIEALREAGLRVPQDVSVVGFDGIENGEYFVPRLTTVEVPLRAIGARGMKVLLQQLEGQHNDVATIVLPTRLQVRESTAPFSGARPRR